MKRISLIWTGLAGVLYLLTLSGCVKEDRSEYCEELVENSFRVYYHYGSAARAAGDDKIELLHLFVFGEDGYLTKTPDIDYSPRVGDSDYYTGVDLEPGNYRFVAWGNLTGAYYVVPSTFETGITHYDDLLVHLEHTNNDSIFYDLHYLYFGDATNEAVTGKGEERVDLYLNHNRYQVNVYIDDPEDVVPDGMRLDLVITDKTSSYRFDNSIYENVADVHYKRSFTVHDVYKFYTGLALVSLDYSRTTMLRLYNSITGELIYEDNLIDLIKSIDINLNDQFEFDIVLRIHGGRIYVMINGWDVTHDDNQIIFG